MNISIWNHDTVSGRIRGRQICEYAGFKRRPDAGFENDVCIFIKWSPAIEKWGKLFIDPIDSMRYVGWAKLNPHSGIIAISRVAEEYLKNEMKNEVVYIPQQHCNMERVYRDRTEVTMAGFCGEYHTFRPFEDEIREKLKKIGMDLLFCYSYKHRSDIVRFYKQIDVQIIWREDKVMNPLLKNPLKLSNAGSFAIPTVSQDEINFKREYEGCYVPAKSIDDLVDKVALLKNDGEFYLEMAERARNRAEHYHISNVVKRYLELAQ